MIVREQRSPANGRKNYRPHPLVEIELRKRNRNVCSNRLGRKKKNTSEGRPPVTENVRSNRALHLHWNRLNWKFCLNGKRPGISKNVPKIFHRLRNNVENDGKCPPTTFEHYQNLACYNTVTTKSLACFSGKLNWVFLINYRVKVTLKRRSFFSALFLLYFFLYN